MSAKKPTTMLGHVATRRVEETYSDLQQCLFVIPPNLTDRINALATLKSIRKVLRLFHESNTYVT